MSQPVTARALHTEEADADEEEFKSPRQANYVPLNRFVTARSMTMSIPLAEKQKMIKQN